MDESWRCGHCDACNEMARWDRDVDDRASNGAGSESDRQRTPLEVFADLRAATPEMFG